MQYLPTKMIETILKKVEALEVQMKELQNFVKTDEEKLHSEFSQTLSAQREEIIRLRIELSQVKREQRIRRINALKSFKSE